MSTFKEVFEGKHVFIAVVHVEGGAQAIRNASIARQEGADGIFLINHSIPYSNLLECYEAVRKKFPDFWVGLNCLDIGRSAVSVIPKNTAGLWVDNAGGVSVEWADPRPYNGSSSRLHWTCRSHSGGAVFDSLVCIAY